MRFVIRLLLLLAAGIAVYAIAERAAPREMAAATLHLERALGGLQTRQLTVNGLDIAYLDTGPHEGEPLLVLHGFGADKKSFRHRRRAAARHRPHCRDRPARLRRQQQA